MQGNPHSGHASIPIQRATSASAIYHAQAWTLVDGARQCAGPLEVESLVAPGIGHISDRTPCNVDAIIPSRKWAIAIALHALERSLPKHISIRHQHLHSFRETDATRLLNFCTSSVSFPFTPSRCRGQIPLRLLGLIMMITRARTDNEKNITPGFTFLGAAREPEVR